MLCQGSFQVLYNELEGCRKRPKRQRIMCYRQRGSKHGKGTNRSAGFCYGKEFVKFTVSLYPFVLLPALLSCSHMTDCSCWCNPSLHLLPELLSSQVWEHKCSGRSTTESFVHLHYCFPASTREILSEACSPFLWVVEDLFLVYFNHPLHVPAHLTFDKTDLNPMCLYSKAIFGWPGLFTISDSYEPLWSVFSPHLFRSKVFPSKIFFLSGIYTLGLFLYLWSRYIPISLHSQVFQLFSPGKFASEFP